MKIARSLGKNVDNAGYIKKVKKRKKISVHPNVYICNVFMENLLNSEELKIESLHMKE